MAETSKAGKQFGLRRWYRRIKHNKSIKKLYCPLDMEKKEIHVVTILPFDDDSAPIECEHETVSLLDEPEFDAPSYVW